MASRAQLLEDRALRDAARRNLDADIAFVRGDVEAQGVASRLMDGGADGAREAAGAAQDYASENPGLVASGAGLFIVALGAWLMRDRIADMVHDLLGPDRDEDDMEQMQPDARSPNTRS